jgi:hypothetical protein
VTEFFAGDADQRRGIDGLFSGQESWAKRLVSFCWPGSEVFLPGM